MGANGNDNNHSNGNGNNHSNGSGHKPAVPTAVILGANPYHTSNAVPPGDVADSFAEDLIIEEDETETPAQEDAGKMWTTARKRQLAAVGVLLIAVVGIGLGIWMRFGGRSATETHIVETRQPITPAPPELGPDPADKRVEEKVHQALTGTKTEAKPGVPAIANPQVSPTPLTQPTGQPTGQSSGQPAPNIPGALPSDIGRTVTAPEAETPPAKTDATTPAAAATSASGITTGTQASAQASTSTPQGNSSSMFTGQSIYVSEADKSLIAKPANNSPQVPPAAPPAMVRDGATAALRDVLPGDAPPVVAPGFGSVLPVRALGAIYTLRSGSPARFELTRDTSGRGWSMKRGTVLVGTIRGSEHERAFVDLVGFLDPHSNRLARIGGEVLGGDGATGLRGKRRSLSGGWARALGPIFNGAVGITQSAFAGKGGGTTIIMPQASGALSSELSSLSGTAARKEFVEVPAGASGYVMITELPAEVKDVNPIPELTLTGDAPPGISEAELASLMATGDAEKVRAALPRMTPEMRRIAEAVIREPQER